MCLSPKCYCQVGHDKHGNEWCKPKAKGVSKHLNNLTFEMYLDVLETGVSAFGRVEQIRLDKRTTNLVRFSSTKKALTYAYYKRRVNNDGLTTLPILV